MNINPSGHTDLEMKINAAFNMLGRVTTALVTATEECKTAQIAIRDGLTAVRSDPAIFVPVEEAMRLMSLSRSSINRLLGRVLPKHKFGNAVRIRRSDIENLIAAEEEQK